MSDPQHQAAGHHEGGDESHEGPIRTPRQLVYTVVASFVVPVIIIILLVNYVASGSRTGAGSDGMDPEAVARRIQPVGSVEIRDMSAPGVLRSGEQVYQGQCMACHGTGAAGAPKLGDAEAWAPRIKTGFEALLNSALKGKGAMAPQGGGEFTDVEVARGVVFMANKAGAGFAEPQAPAAAASSADAAASGAGAAPAAAAPASAASGQK